MILLKFSPSKIKGWISLFFKISGLLIIRHFYNKRKPIIENLCGNNLNKENLIIITIAFNNVEIIKQQYYYLKKYLEEKFCYIVVDNSNITDLSNSIHQYCILSHIIYIKLPPNPFLKDPSFSHGQAIDWSHKNIIKKLHPTFFGFIDHDVLPFRETKITPYVKNGLLGPIRENNGKWYLWAGFCFYEYNKIKKYDLNFLPHYELTTKGLTYLDTGGSNYYKIYKKYNKNDLFKIERLYFDLKTEKMINNEDKINTTIEIMGDWIHLIRTSSWDNKDNNKLYTIENIIDITKKNL